MYTQLRTKFIFSRLELWIIPSFFFGGREGGIIIEPLSLRVERKGVSVSYSLKTHPVPTVIPCQACGISFERFLWPWQRSYSLQFQSMVQDKILLKIVHIFMVMAARIQCYNFTFTAPLFRSNKSGFSKTCNCALYFITNVLIENTTFRVLLSLKVYDTTLKSKPTHIYNFKSIKYQLIVVEIRLICQ